MKVRLFSFNENSRRHFHDDSPIFINSDDIIVWMGQGVLHNRPNDHLIEIGDQQLYHQYSLHSPKLTFRGLSGLATRVWIKKSLGNECWCKIEHIRPNAHLLTINYQGRQLALCNLHFPNTRLFRRCSAINRHRRLQRLIKIIDTKISRQVPLVLAGSFHSQIYFYLSELVEARQLHQPWSIFWPVDELQTEKRLHQLKEEGPDFSPTFPLVTKRYSNRQLEAPSHHNGQLAVPSYHFRSNVYLSWADRIVYRDPNFQIRVTKYQRWDAPQFDFSNHCPITALIEWKLSGLAHEQNSNFLTY